MNYPETPSKTVTEECHGIKIEDPYRWLETAHDPAVQAWTDTQNDLMRTTLDAVPQRAAFYEQLKKIYGEASPEYGALQVRASKIFAKKKQPPLQQPLLVALTSVDDLTSERVILDPNQLDPSGGTAIDFYVASLDGKKAAISISKGRSERGDLTIYDSEPCQPLNDFIPRVQVPTGGGSFAWTENNDGLYYTRYPRLGERPDDELDFYQQVYFHKLGQTESEDIYMIGRDFPKIAECLMDTTSDGKYLLLMVKNGDGGEVAHYIRDPQGNWAQVTQFEDEAKDARLGEDQHLYLLSRQNAPLGKILRIPLDKPHLNADQVIVPEGSLSIQSFLPTQNYLYIAELDGGPSRLRVVDHQGQHVANVPVEPVSGVYSLVHAEADTVLFFGSSYLSPSGWSRYSPATSEGQRTALFSTCPVDFSDCEVLREFATSRDCTRVPVNIIRRKGTKLDGMNPKLIYGYGGFRGILFPYF